ncbi:MAG: sigma-54 dependent transcriptional regulator [Gemmatimonadota bacterium]|nr:sigma-54 dependent transcriptional regulator [Gemmatimonadota bacterium]
MSETEPNRTSDAAGPEPRLVVISLSRAFERAWDGIAAAAGLSLRRVATPEEPRGGNVAAVIVACGGAEERALETVHACHRAGIDAPLVVGAEADHRLAVELMRRGAGAYFVLPADLERLQADIAERAAARHEPDDDALERFRRRSYDFSEILGEDTALRASLERAARVIPGGRATVLIAGETGTGKELLARAIHYNGPRAGEPFVAVNCSAIPANLLESELFGHEKGSFTGAAAAKPGLFEVADGGTLFLDEIATLPLELQAKLLRALETREVRRVGGIRDVAVDVRILAAANVDLADRVAAGEFREDLYYRLAVVPIVLPPLRERGDDVVRLARHFLARLSDEYGLEPPAVSPGAVAALRRHRWPGNVRELRNAVERALLLAGGGAIAPEHLALGEGSAAPTRSTGEGPAAAGPGALPFPATLEEIERAAARAAVERCGGNKSEAARLLGTTRSRLYRLLAET